MRISSVTFGLPLAVVLLAVVGAQADMWDCGTSSLTGVAHSCNSASYQPNSPLQSSLTAIITDLEQNTGSEGHYRLIDETTTYYNTITNTNEFPAAYGKGVCGWSIPPDYCTACLTTLANCISSACGPTVGAWAQQNDHFCYMRYETYKFY